MKHYEETTTYKCYEFTTNCKKLTTALDRMIKIYPEIEQDIRELKDSYEWYNGDFNECDDTTVYGDKQMPTYRFIVEFDGEFCYICMYYYINNATDTKDTGSDTNNETDNDSTNKTPAELKAEINKKYGVNAVYYDTDSILCDNSKQNVYVAQYNTNNLTPQPCYIKAYYDDKEITIPKNNVYKCRECAIVYIHNLFTERFIPYETLFILYYGKHVETITIENVVDTSDLLHYNIDDINHGLKHDCYKYVRDGINHICDIITDDMKISIDLDKTQYCTITKSRYYGYYCFKFVNAVYTKKPCDFARWLYTQTFTHRIDLKCWYRNLRGETK